MEIKGVGRLESEIFIPGDKSISHRSVIFSALSKGETVIENILMSDDVKRTIDCFRRLGVQIDYDIKNKCLVVVGVGKNGLKKYEGELYCGNSGTTMRLLAGLLSGQSFNSKLTGDSSLVKRPMDRIIEPIENMGGKIHSKKGRPPLYIEGKKKLSPIEYIMPVDSAQVKSAIILASLYAGGDSKIIENNPSRDHTERMLKYFREKNWKVDKLIIPGDVSSAAFFIACGLLGKTNELIMRNIGINETRMGFIEVLKKMGGNIEINNIKILNNEEVGDILVKPSRLNSVKIGKEIIGRMVDEIPILAVVAAFADGQTIITGAEELRYKETDRLKATYEGLRNFNVRIKELKDGLIIEGMDNNELRPAIVESYGDHRMAMAFSILAYNIKGKSKINGWESVDISFPNFYENLKIK